MCLTVKIEKIFVAVIGAAGRKTQPEQSWFPMSVYCYKLT